MGAGFCPQKGVWLPLAASQTLCLPHLWVGHIQTVYLNELTEALGKTYEVLNSLLTEKGTVVSSGNL